MVVFATKSINLIKICNDNNNNGNHQTEERIGKLVSISVIIKIYFLVILHSTNICSAMLGALVIQIILVIYFQV